ncbi:unnamed protein product [Caenorhabditis nigoni]
MESNNGSYRRIRRRCIDGYTCLEVPAIYSYIAPTLINIDPFHIRGAGVCKDIVQEFQKSTKWRNFKIMANKLEMLQFSVDSIIPYTGEKIKSQSYKKLSKATGREVDKLSIITSALVGITGSCNSMDFNALVLGWYYCLEFLGSVLAPQRSLRLLLDACYKLHVVLESQSITLKWHTFYHHLLDHERIYGHLHTTEIFEREHKTIMTSVNHQTTQCERILVSRYVTGKVTAKRVLNMAPLYASQIENAIVGSLRIDRKSSEKENCGNSMTWDQLMTEHVKLATELGISMHTRFLKRIHLKTILGDLQFSAERYWRNSSSTSSIISYVDPKTGAFQYGVIEFIFYHNDSTFMVVREFLLEALRLTVNSWADGLISLEAQEVLDCCLAFPTVLGKVVGHYHTLIPSSSVLCPAIVISFGGSTYVKICLSYTCFMYPATPKIGNSDLLNGPKKEFRSPNIDGTGQRVSTSGLEASHGMFARPILDSSDFVDPARSAPTVLNYLEAAVKNNELNIYEAGLAVHNGYASQDPSVPDQVLAFVQKYALRITSSRMPPVSPSIHPDYIWIMTHGYGIVSQIALAAANKNNMKTITTSLDLGNLTGALCNIDNSEPIYYPQEAPFNGDRIEVKQEMPRQLNAAAHIVTKKLIFTILSRSCSDPTDLQSIVWSIPEDTTVCRALNPRPFPRTLYDSIQNIVLQFFRLDEELLSRGVYDEQCATLKCLSGITDPIARKKKYASLHIARTRLTTTTYHHQFKSALYDLKTAVYIPPPNGQRFGTFKLASHAKSTKRGRTEDE